MGRGNFLPIGIMTDQWYIDYERYWLYSEEEDEDSDPYFDDITRDIELEEVMMKIKERFPSFVEVEKSVDSYWGQVILLENELFDIGVADNEWSMAIWISERRDKDDSVLPLAMGHIENYKREIRRILLNYFGEISLRNGAWMSIRWTQEMEKMTGYKPEEQEVKA